MLDKAIKVFSLGAAEIERLLVALKRKFTTKALIGTSLIGQVITNAGTVEEGDSFIAFRTEAKRFSQQKMMIGVNGIADALVKQKLNVITKGNLRGVGGYIPLNGQSCLLFVHANGGDEADAMLYFHDGSRLCSISLVLCRKTSPALVDSPGEAAIERTASEKSSRRKLRVVEKSSPRPQDPFQGVIPAFTTTDFLVTEVEQEILSVSRRLEVPADLAGDVFEPIPDALPSPLTKQWQNITQLLQAVERDFSDKVVPVQQILKQTEQRMWEVVTNAPSTQLISIPLDEDDVSGSATSAQREVAAPQALPPKAGETPRKPRQQSARGKTATKPKQKRGSGGSFSWGTEPPVTSVFRDCELTTRRGGVTYSSGATGMGYHSFDELTRMMQQRLIERCVGGNGSSKGSYCDESGIDPEGIVAGCVMAIIRFVFEPEFSSNSAMNYARFVQLMAEVYNRFSLKVVPNVCSITTPERIRIEQFKAVLQEYGITDITFPSAREYENYAIQIRDLLGAMK